MILTERQLTTLKLFEDGKLLSPQALVKELNIAKGIAQNRIAELHDKGLIRKMNQTQYQISGKGKESLGHPMLPPAKKPDPLADDDRPLTEKEMDRLLDGAVDELVGVRDDEEVIEVPEPEQKPEPMTLEQFAELPAEPAFDAQFAAPAEQFAQAAESLLPEHHPAMLAIERLQKQLNSPRPVPIKDLDLKREVLVQLARLLEQSISDVLVNIADDLDRAAGN